MNMAQWPRLVPLSSAKSQIGRAFLPDVEAEGARADGPIDPGDLQKSNLFFRQPFALIFPMPAQAGYGDKWTS
jgi:hypothetical protein